MQVDFVSDMFACPIKRRIVITSKNYMLNVCLIKANGVLFIILISITLYLLIAAQIFNGCLAIV